MTDRPIEVMARVLYENTHGKYAVWPPNYEDVYFRYIGTAKAVLAALNSAGYAVVPVEPTDQNLDERLAAKGMLTVEQCLQPASKFHVNVGMTTPAFFEQWLERKAREYISMNARYEIGDKEKDELYEWVLAHMGAFKEVLVNYRAMIEATK